MARKVDKTELKKGEASFQLIGEAKITDFTFKIDEESKSSDWVYNSLNLGVDCGDCGTIYSEMMGGYGAERDNVVYVHGKKENDNGNEVDDYENSWKIDWDDRLDESLFEEIGNNCFIKVGIEKDSKGKTFTKLFLSEYDAINYIKEHLEDKMVINVKGKIEHSPYNDYVQSRKKIQSVFLSKADDSSKYKATFTQTILVDKDSVGKVDKDKNAYPIDAYVVEYIGSPKINNKKVEIKKNVLFPKSYDFEIKDEEKTKKLVDKLFSPRKESVFAVTVDGVIRNGKGTITATYDDLPEDIQELVDLDALTLEEALEKCVGKSNSHETYIIVSPKINRVGKGEEKVPVIAIDKERYTVNDYLMYSEVLPSDDKDDDEVKKDSKKQNAKTSSKNDTEEDDDDDIDIDDLLDGIDD